MQSEFVRESVEVTPADREAALAIRLYTTSLKPGDHRYDSTCADYRSGRRDDWESTQIVARHRIDSTTPPTSGDSSVERLREARSADDLRDIIRAWLARDCDWGDWEKALDRLVEEEVSERSAVVAMLRSDADTMRRNAEAYREEAPSDARALSEVATTLAIKAFQIERGDHLKDGTAALSPAVPSGVGETLSQRQAREVMNPASGSVTASSDGQSYATPVAADGGAMVEALRAIVQVVADADSEDCIGSLDVDIPRGGYPRQWLRDAARAALSGAN